MDFRGDINKGEIIFNINGGISSDEAFREGGSFFNRDSISASEGVVKENFSMTFRQVCVRLSEVAWGRAEWFVPKKELREFAIELTESEALP